MERLPAVADRTRALTWPEVGRAALLLAVILVLFTFPAFVGDELASVEDGPRLYYPFQLHAWSMLARGDLPTWSNTLMGGFPIMASSQAVMFYPANWIFGLFRTPVAYNVVTLLHVWIAGLGAYVWVRALKTSPLAAFVAALAMMFGASMAARVASGHIGEIYNRAWMVWMLVAILFLARRPTWRRMLATGTIFGLMLLAGSAGYQMVMYTGMIAAVWGLYLLATETQPAMRWRFILWSAVAVIVGIGLSAVQTLPSYDLLQQGNRQGQIPDEALDAFAQPVLAMTGFFLPHTYDDPHITFYSWHEIATYSGAAILFLALYAVRRRHRERLVRLWAGIGLVFFLLTFGLDSPLFRLLVEIFPPYGLVRNPARHLAVVQIALVILAALGLDRLLRTPSPALTTPQIRRRAAAIVVAAALVVGMSLVTITEGGEDVYTVFPERLVRGAIWFTAALLAFMLAVQIVRATRAPAAYLALAGVVLLDLGLYARPLLDGAHPVPVFEYTALIPQPEGLPYLAARDERTLTLNEERIISIADEGIPVLNIYSSVLPQRAVRTWNLLAGRAPDAYLENHILLQDIARPVMLDLSGVRWLLEERDEPPFDDNSLHELPADDDGDVRLYENVDALPMAYLVSTWDVVTSPQASIEWLETVGLDEAQTSAVIEGDDARTETHAPGGDAVQSLDLHGGTVTVRVQTGEPRLLVVLQTYVEGWHAEINGISSPVYPANQRWLGVVLPEAGTYEVRLRHLPRSLQAGALISALTLAGMGLALGAGAVAGRQRRTFPPAS